MAYKKVASQPRRFRWFEPILVATILAAVCGKGIESTGFFGDESRWIATSYFAGPFLQGDFSSPVWQESHWTKDQPPVARYIIGIGRRIGGFRAHELNTHWRFDLDDRANIERGAMPAPNLLWWSRFPMALLTVISGCILFYLVFRAAGRVAAYAALVLFVGNPFLLTTLGRAMSESPLLAFILLAAFAGHRAMRSWRCIVHDGGKRKGGVRPLIWFLLMGVFCGLAAGTKLNGMSVLMAGIGLCILFPLSERKISLESRYAAFYACVLGVTAAATFVATNPFLYPDPVERTYLMLQQRLEVMSLQQELFAEFSLLGRPRLAIFRQRIFEEYAGLQLAWGGPLSVLLFVVGLAHLVFIARRRSQNPDDSDAAIVMLLVGLTAVAPALATPLDWDRYYLLPVVFSTAVIAAGIGFAAGEIKTRLSAWVHVNSGRPFAS